MTYDCCSAPGNEIAEEAERLRQENQKLKDRICLNCKRYRPTEIKFCDGCDNSQNRRDMMKRLFGTKTPKFEGVPIPDIVPARTNIGVILFPCPFCGGKAVVEDMGFPHHVYCMCCGARVTGIGYGEDGKESAIMKWNRREKDADTP